MTAEEIFGALSAKYGEDFNWDRISSPQAGEYLVGELKREIGQEHPLYHAEIRAVAKCASNDDVFYVIKGESGEDSYYIFHLTYAKWNAPGYPKYKRFGNLPAAMELIEQAFLMS